MITALSSRAELCQLDGRTEALSHSTLVELPLDNLPVAVRSKLTLGMRVVGVVASRIDSNGLQSRGILVGDTFMPAQLPVELRDGTGVVISLDGQRARVELASSAANEGIGNRPARADRSDTVKLMEDLTSALRRVVASMRLSVTGGSASSVVERFGEQLLTDDDYRNSAMLSAKINKLLAPGDQGSGACLSREVPGSVLDEIVGQRIAKRVGVLGAIRSAIGALRLAVTAVGEQSAARDLDSRLCALSQLLARVSQEDEISGPPLEALLKGSHSCPSSELQRLGERLVQLSNSNPLADLEAFLKSIEGQLKTPSTESDEALCALVRSLGGALSAFSERGTEASELRGILLFALRGVQELLEMDPQAMTFAESKLSEPFARVARQLNATLLTFAAMPDSALLPEAIVAQGSEALMRLGEVAITPADYKLLQEAQESFGRISKVGAEPQYIRRVIQEFVGTVSTDLVAERRASVAGAQSIGEVVGGSTNSPAMHIEVLEQGRSESTEGDLTASVRTRRAIQEYSRVEDTLRVTCDGIGKVLQELLRDPDSARVLRLLVRLSAGALAELPSAEAEFVTIVQKHIGAESGEPDEVSLERPLRRGDLKSLIREMKETVVLARAQELITKSNREAQIPLEGVQQVLESQQLANRLAPAMRVMGEPLVILLPSFIGGIFSTAQIERHDGVVDDDDCVRHRKGERELYRRLRLRVCLPTLGGIAVELVYRRGEIAAVATVGSYAVSSWLEARGPALESMLRAKGYSKISFRVVVAGVGAGDSPKYGACSPYHSLPPVAPKGDSAQRFA